MLDGRFYALGMMEGVDLESKVRLDRGDPQSWLRTVAGFANNIGGDLYIGIDDRTKKLSGFSEAEADEERNYFNNMVNQHLFPRPQTSVEFVPYEEGGSTKRLVRVRIPSSPDKPVVVRFDGVPAIYFRREGFTDGATYEEILQMARGGQRRGYDILPSEEVFREEDFGVLFQRYREVNKKELSAKLLRSIGFFDEKGRLANGALLFRDGPGGRATFQCSAFGGLDRGSDAVTVLKRGGDLLGGIDFCRDFVLMRMNTLYIKRSDGRDEIPAYPERALLEGLVNAAAHRDYYIDNSQIQVDLFRDRLEISSPGSFYLGGPLEATYDLSSIISKRRNELVCDVLVMLKLMEASGTGFEKIAEDYKDADERHKPYIFSKTDHFTLVLPDLTYESGLSGYKSALSYIPPRRKGRYDDAILAFCYGAERTALEVARELGVSDSTYLRGSILRRLVDSHLLLASKDGGRTRYLTNQELVQRS